MLNLFAVAVSIAKSTLNMDIQYEGNLFSHIRRLSTKFKTISCYMFRVICINIKFNVIINITRALQEILRSLAHYSLHSSLNVTSAFQEILRSLAPSLIFAIRLAYMSKCHGDHY